MKKRIGIPGWKVGENSFGATITYLEYIKRFGNPVIIMPNEDFAAVDALLLPGGADLPPSSYGQYPSFYTSNHDVFKQYFFTNCLHNYVGKVPIFGICLGFQMLNVFFDGSLEQNLIYHDQSLDRWKTAHSVEIINTPGWERKKDNKPITIKVNSHHHQGVTTKGLSPHLIPVAITDNVDDDYKSDLIEAFKHEEFPIAGVQWHPEELYDEFSTKLFNEILNF